MAGRAAPGRNQLRRSAARRIVRLARIGPADLVVEVGAGAGALTVPLAGRAYRVVALEPDPRLAARLEDRCRALTNVRILRADALRLPFPAGPYRVLANPPFAITSALLRRLLDPRSGARRLDLVLEGGVVRLWTARRPGRRSPLVAAPWWSFSRGPRVRASEFLPPPGSDAAVLIAIRRDPPLLPVALRPLHAELVARALSRGPSPLRRVLRDRLPDRAWSRMAAEAGIPREAAARELSGAQWAAVTAAVVRSRR